MESEPKGRKEELIIVHPITYHEGPEREQSSTFF
jgi:hypothetical protein